MADRPISGTPAATLPLTGTELVPVVQGGVTKHVPSAALAAPSIVTFTDEAAFNAAVPVPGQFMVLHNA